MKTKEVGESMEKRGKVGNEKHKRESQRKKRG